VHDVGFLDCADIGALSLVVLADEVIAMVKRIMRGVEVNQETIMLDLIKKVGPGKHFLAERESVSLCRREIWVPEHLDRDPYIIWEQKGAISMEDRLNETVKKILATHQPAPLLPGAAEKIESILASAERRY